MSDPLSNMMRTPARRKTDDPKDADPRGEDMLQSMREASGERDTSIIQIKTNIDLQESAEGMLVHLTTMFELPTILQFSVILALIFFALSFSAMGRRRILGRLEESEKPILSETGQIWIRRVTRAFFPAALALFLFICTQAAAWMNWPNDLLMVGMQLAVAGTVIRFLSTLIHSRVTAKWVAGVIWGVAALHIVGWWAPMTSLLGSIHLGLGEDRISLLGMLKGTFYFVLFLWLAGIVSRASEKKLKKIEEMTPSLRVLFTKLLRISLIFIACLLGLNAIGVDLTSFAILGGAVGLGLGFGLQKVVSNFVSGIILLLDRSIKPGDVIAIDKSFGWVNTLGARYVSIIQRDGREHLIPNEQLITEKVENWSFSNNDVRIPINVGVAYGTDLRKALELCLEAAIEEPRVKQFPKPVVRITGFGDSAVNIEIRGWINDPVNGIGNIKSDVFLRVWDKFQENGVEIPFPQRDLHLKSFSPDVTAQLKKELREELKKELLEEMQQEKTAGKK